MNRAVVPHLVLTLLVIGVGVAQLTSPPGHARLYMLVAAALLAGSLLLVWRHVREREKRRG